MWAITKKRLRIFTRSKMLETAKIYGIILKVVVTPVLRLWTIVDDNGVLRGIVEVMVAAGKKTGDPNTSPNFLRPLLLQLEMNSAI
jgi:hypothetical protein